MTDLLRRRGDYAQITEEGIIRIAKSFDQVMTLLLDRRRGEVNITEEVVEAAAGNLQSGKEVMALLLDQYSDRIAVTPRLVRALAKSFDALTMRKFLTHCSDQVKITEEVVEAAAGNSSSSKEVMALLLDQCGDRIAITPWLVQMLAKSFDALTMRKLLTDHGDEVKITEEVVEAAAGNLISGKEVVALLLDQRGDEVKITEAVVKAAAGNSYSGNKVMILLLDQYSNRVIVTPRLVRALAKFDALVMRKFLTHHGDEVKITEEVLKEAASNESAGGELIKFLHQAIGIKVTAGLIEAASTCGQEQVLCLPDQWDNIGSDKESWVKVSRLYNATKSGDTADVRKLVNDGIPPDKQNIRGITPLWAASSRGHIAVVQVLLATNSVRVNVRNVNGQTPLFRAAAHGHSKAVQLLLDHGAEYAYIDEDGRSPLSVAQLNGRANVIDILTKHAVKPVNCC